MTSQIPTHPRLRTCHRGPGILPGGYLILLILSLSFAHAADPSPEDLLRQGLFEEEANQNLDKAAEHYRAVIVAHDRQRALAASATFRLGEIARKKNDKDAAAAAFRTVTERFPEQQELARISRENLAALGIEVATPALPATADPEDAEIARLKEIARNSPDLIDGTDADGLRPLHHAAANGWVKVIGHLLESGADPNGLTALHSVSPLHVAAGSGHLGAVKALLAAKADPNLTFDFKHSGAIKLLPRDPRVNQATGTWTALDLAIVNDRRETARTLIDAGTDIRRVGPVISGYPDGFNTLLLAIHFKRNDLAQALIDAGSPMGAVGNKAPRSPLGHATSNNPAMVAPLLKAGADPKLPERAERYTPLHFASSSSITTAKLLIETGADVKATTTTGVTPLHWALNAEIAELLILKGADPNAKDTDGLTPLDNVVSRDEAGPNVALVETLLKHGVTVADPLSLLRRTSSAMLPLVRERLVYSKMHRPDAILLSVDGYHTFNPIETTPSDRRLRPRVVSGSPQARPDLIRLEIRPSPASPPPSLAEVLREAFQPENRPQSIRILRRGANDRFESIREWTPSGTTVPTEWPALEWGDIVEVRNSSGGNADTPRILDFAALIPDRTVSFRLGELEFPKTIPGSETFWLDGDSGWTLPSLIPHNIALLANLNGFVIHRKGLPEPVTLDFSEPTETRFRLLEGDTVEMSWDIPTLSKNFSAQDGFHLVSLAGKGETGRVSGMNLAEILASRPVTPPINFTKICILRRAENWKPKIVDFKAWLDQLPPAEKWEKDALVASMPKLNPGDVLILIQNHGADAEKTAAEVLEKTKEVSSAMIGRPPVVPPPQAAPMRK